MWRPVSRGLPIPAGWQFRTPSTSMCMAASASISSTAAITRSRTSNARCISGPGRRTPARPRPYDAVGGTPPPPPSKPSIAVLPFDNMSGDPEQGYFADGITEDIITDLSKVSGLFVIARNSSFAYKGQAPDIRKVSRELGVRYVLEGSVRRAASRVRINAQMIDGTTGGHLWAERYDRDTRRHLRGSGRSDPHDRRCTQGEADGRRRGAA